MSAGAGACGERRRPDRAGFAILFAVLLASALYLGFGLAASLTREAPGWAPHHGQPIGHDFVAFWTAATLALDGAPEAAFDVARLQSMEAAVAGHPVDAVPWHYPPSFELLVLPLGLLAYPLALALWLMLPMAGFAVLLRHFVDVRLALGLAVLFPATAQCLISGQNGVLFAAVLLGGLLLLERRPFVAGLVLAVLACKPQLTPLLGPALIFGGERRALLGLIVGAAVLAAASVAVLKPDAWPAFVSQMPAAASLLETGVKPWPRMPTVFAAASLLGAGATTAWSAQIVAALAAAAAVAWAWRRRRDTGARAAALGALLPFATPFAFDYDLVVWLLPLLWLARDGALGVGDRAGRAVVLLGWLAPVGGWLLAWQFGIPAMTAAGLVLAGTVLRRLGRPPAPGVPLGLRGPSGSPIFRRAGRGSAW